MSDVPTMGSEIINNGKSIVLQAEIIRPWAYHSVFFNGGILHSSCEHFSVKDENLVVGSGVF